MQYIRPDYFNEFKCVGGECPDNCCAGWQIVIDKDSLEKYKHQEGAFGNRLRNEIDWEEGVFHQYNGDCCFLNDEKLCDIYSEIGEENLCYTCKNYPRFTEEFDNLKEQFLCMSCPVVAEMLLGRNEKVTLISSEDDEEMEEIEDFDFLMFDKLQSSRNYLLDMLQTREHDIRLRQGILAAFGHDMQRRVRNLEFCTMDSLIEKYKGANTWSFFKDKKNEYGDRTADRYLVSKAMFKELEKLEIRKHEWERWLKRCELQLFAEGARGYLEVRQSFLDAMASSKKLEDEMALYLEQIMVYFLLHYYCGSVYDDNVYAKVKLSVLSALVIEEMICAKWNISGKLPKKSDWVAITYQYAREIEHSDENLETLDGVLVSEKVFGIQSLEKAILGLQV
ncbi:MAG: flagellin lysine-N-methylase [Lachnospiraceae bacterium]|nr:flagellin lysine-N-methylase [Lachnospiraceae bacterium]